MPPHGPRKSAVNPAPWRFFAVYFRGRSGAIAVCVIAAMSQSLATLPMIPLVRLAVDRALPRGDIGLLVAIGLGLVLLRAAGGAAMVWTHARVMRLKGEVTLRLRRDLLIRLYARPHLSHVRALNSHFTAHVVIDAERADVMIDSVLGGGLPAALTCAAMGGVLLYLNAWLAAVGAICLPLVWVAGRWAARRIHANVVRYHAAHDAFVRGIRFVVDNFALTRARAAEDAETDRQMHRIERLRSSATHLVVDNLRIGQVQTGLIGLVGVVILIAGGIAVANHAMTIGALMAFLAAAALAGGQVSRLIATLPVVIEGGAALSRLRAQMGETVVAPYAGRRDLAWTGRVALEGVSFAYDGPPVLRGVSLSLAPGDIVGIVGANGAGKTTILNLILGLYRPGDGRLTADGVAYDALDIRALRRRIGLAPQEPRFFDGSVFDNITYGSPDATQADVEALAERIGAAPFLRRLPGGLDAAIGETGLLLSGGERQRLAILRALVGQPRLLVLDEPTNHLDREAVRAVVGALMSMPDRPAVLVISHDLDAVSGVDRLYRLVDGRLTAIPLVMAR